MKLPYWLCYIILDATIPSKFCNLEIDDIQYFQTNLILAKENASWDLTKQKEILHMLGKNPLEKRCFSRDDV